MPLTASLLAFPQYLVALKTVQVPEDSPVTSPSFQEHLKVTLTMAVLPHAQHIQSLVPMESLLRLRRHLS